MLVMLNSNWHFSHYILLYCTQTAIKLFSYGHHIGNGKNCNSQIQKCVSEWVFVLILPWANETRIIKYSVHTVQYCIVKVKYVEWSICESKICGMEYM